MADSVSLPLTDAMRADSEPPRHAALVRITHWLAAFGFLALLVSGAEIVISHPRFYWGESGNVLTPPLFKLSIPSSRAMVPTGYGYVLPDQNGWSRALHFQSAWLLVFAGLIYIFWGLFTRHFRKNLLPGKADFSNRGLVLRSHVQLVRASENDSYNALQKLTYLFVIFVLFPLVVWTGIALSPAFDSAFPVTVTLLGGRQSARTLHFFVSIALLLFLIIHLTMICVAGFRNRMGAMILGRAVGKRERK